jgi:hypothetical protein
MTIINRGIHPLRSMQLRLRTYTHPKTKYEHSILHNNLKTYYFNSNIQGVPLSTEPGISLILLPLMRILQGNLKRTYLIVLKFHCNIFIGVRIITEMLGSVVSGTPCSILD